MDATPPLRDLSERIARVRRMAYNLGVDIDANVSDGRLSPQDAYALVLRCLECPRPADCGEWLEDYPDGAAAPPAYCRNIALFEWLRGDRGREGENPVPVG